MNHDEREHNALTSGFSALFDRFRERQSDRQSLERLSTPPQRTAEPFRRKPDGLWSACSDKGSY